MTTAVSEFSSEAIALRQQANYWRAQHGRVVEREAVWKKEKQEFQELVRELKAHLWLLWQAYEKLKARNVWLEQQVFGRKTEKASSGALEEDEPEPEVSNSPEEPTQPSGEAARNRGKQAGSKGYGRKQREDLPSKPIVHDLAPQEQCCPNCGKPFIVFPGTEDSEEIDREVTLIRRIHKRKRYRPTCQCQAVPGIVTAQPPAKVIPKGMFSIRFWTHLLLEKFLFQRPLYRIRQVLELEGLVVSGGTLTGGFQRIGTLLQPLYVRILERNRQAKHWHMDETRWMVFVEVEGKKGHRWWLWVSVTEESCVYLLDPSRSSEVPKKHLGEDAEGIISADRYAAYKALGDKILVAFCWMHIRRDFVRIHNGYKKLRGWAQAWLKRIADLFRLNAKRVQELSNPDAFRIHDQHVRDALASMEEIRERELADPKLTVAARKALESLKNHWEGATLFVDHPEIPMDNGESERRLRNPVVGRKNYYGSGSVWSGLLSAMLFTIFQTCLLNRINPQQFLMAYLEACAQNGGRAPENLDAFLPWNLSQERKTAWRYPRPPP